MKRTSLRHQRKLRNARQARYRQRAHAKAIAALGGRCARCGANGGTPLEIAHRNPVFASGDPRRNGRRGMDRQLREFRREPSAFWALCRPCHVEVDGYRPDLRGGAPWAS